MSVSPTAILLSPRPLVVDAARSVGVRVLVLAPALRASAAAPLADVAIEIDWQASSDVADVVSQLATSASAASVFGFGESSALVAAQLNEQLDLPGNPSAAVERF